MAEAITNPPPKPEPAPERELFDVIFNSAWEAFGGAFLFYILGGVALSVAGSFAAGMIPSAPPGFAGSESAEGHHSLLHKGWRNIEGTALLVCVFVIFFAHSLWVNLRTRDAALGKRTALILTNLRENWFSIILGNAISAWVATLLMGIIPNFSLLQMVWDWILGETLPVVRKTAIDFFGASNVATVGDWISWYHANNIKLAFWLLYLAGALDDLGVPNIKALGRWAWRRYQKRKGEPVAPSPAVLSTSVEEKR